MKQKRPDLSRLLSSLVLEEPYYLVEPLNWAGHVPFAFWVIEELRPKMFVELGTHSGLSYFAFCQAVKSLGMDTACFAVDTWKGDFQAGFYGEEIYQEVLAHHSAHFDGFARLVRSTFDEALSHFSDKSIDLLHFDGCHTYEAVKHDFDNWLPKLSDRAVVLIHDINVKERDFGSWRLWEELQSRYPTFGFLHSHGLGVAGIGSNLPDNIKWLFNQSVTSEETVSYIRTFFSQLGRVITERFETIHAAKELSDCKNKIQSMSSDLGELAKLKEDIFEKTGRIETLESELRDLRSNLEANTQNIQSQKVELESLNMETTRLRGINERLKTELFESNSKLENVFDSYSWKVSAPLRTISRILYSLPYTIKSGIRSLYWLLTFQSQKRRFEEKLVHLLLKSNLFDVKYYRNSYPDIPSSDDDAVLHYILYGGFNGYDPNLLFDSSFYLETYPDVAASGENPLVHYLQKGIFEGRDPHALFDTSFYLDQNPDVAELGVNPLAHYLTFGRKEGRLINRHRLHVVGQS